MKPLKLRMQAFGSYGELAEIDFEKPNQNLFLITGDTGAGKTTIFDAIVFALYGEASSGTNRKEQTELQSQYLDYGITPFVELEFLEGAGEGAMHCVVRRVPRHIRPMKRRTGIKEEGGTVSLRMPDGREYSQKEADSRIEELIGLTKGQFMQVAMIAQGEFMELLRAKSDDKKVIFRKLFGTQLYQNISDELAGRSREKKQELTRIKTACQAEASHVAVDEAYENAGQLRKLKDGIMTGDGLTAAELEAFQNELEGMCRWQKERFLLAEELNRQAREIRDRKRDTLTQAQELIRYFEQKAQAEKELSDCEAKAEGIRSLLELAQRIQAAWEIQSSYTCCQDAGKNVAADREGLSEQRSLLPARQERARKAEESEKEAQLGKQEQLAAFSRISDRVKKELALFDRLRAMKEEIRKKEKEKCTAREKADSAREKLKSLEEEDASCRRQAEELEDADQKLAKLQTRQAVAQELQRDLRESKKWEKTLEDQKRKAQKAADRYGQACQAYEKKNTEYESFRRDFLNEQAGFLAREQLRPGEPCPVCGSLQHPSPCRLSKEHENLTREELDRLSLEAGRLRTEQEQLAAQARTEAELLTERSNYFRTSLDRLWEKLKEALPAQTQELEADLVRAESLLEAWLRMLKEESDQARREADKRAALLQRLKEIEKARPIFQETARQAEQTAAEAEKSLERDLAAYQALDREKEFSSRGEAEAALKQAEGNKAKAETSYQKAKKEYEEALGLIEQCQALIRRYEKELPEREEELLKRRQDYEAVMEKQDLTEAEWKELVAGHQRQEAEQIRRQAEDFRARKAAAAGRLSAAEEAIAGQEKPDIQMLQNEWEAAEADMLQRQKELESIRDLFKANQGAYESLAPKMAERSRIVEECNRIEGLYRLVSGNVTGSRMDLETFVQRYYLERILQAANRRFREMSAGQFELRMYELEKAGEGKNRGLDLMVYSAVTGKERQVRTLSGGESFMAALSLALGMADQIQQSTAAVNLDILFIDEGFGSLDDHSRDQAVRVLTDMARGSRMVGIISHVTELKHTIEDKLLVTKDEKGSHVHWEIS